DPFTFIPSPNPPSPPSHFRGKVFKNECCKPIEYIHRLSWRPSQDPNVIEYMLRRNGQVIAKLPAGTSFFTDHHRKKNKKDHYSLVAVNGSGLESKPVSLTLP